MKEKISLSEAKASLSLDWKTRFRIIASKAAKGNRNPDVYSITEEPIRRELEEEGFVERYSFFHEYRVEGYKTKGGRTVYYWLDFFLPRLRLAIEADGEIWHNFFGMRARDRKRDTILKRKHGIKVVRLRSYETRKIRIKKIIRRVIRRRIEELRLEGGENFSPFNQ